jgi:CopG family transcriptional regulator/antitoxin EndoAI
MIAQTFQITLPEDTLKLIEQLASSETDISHLINEAIKFYAAHKHREILRQRVIEGAVCRAERDLNLAQDWFVIEEEACQDF